MSLIVLIDSHGNKIFISSQLIALATLHYQNYRMRSNIVLFLYNWSSCLCSVFDLIFLNSTALATEFQTMPDLCEWFFS